MAYTRSESKCGQKFTDRRLMVVDPSAPEKGVFTDFFRIPTGCSCTAAAPDAVAVTAAAAAPKSAKPIETTTLSFPIDVFSPADTRSSSDLHNNPL